MTTDDPTQPHPIIPERIMTTAELATLLTAGLRLEGFDPDSPPCSPADSSIDSGSRHESERPDRRRARRRMARRLRARDPTRTRDPRTRARRIELTLSQRLALDAAYRSARPPSPPSSTSSPPSPPPNAAATHGTSSSGPVRTLRQLRQRPPDRPRPPARADVIEQLRDDIERLDHTVDELEHSTSHDRRRARPPPDRLRRRDGRGGDSPRNRCERRTRLVSDMRGRVALPLRQHRRRRRRDRQCRNRRAPDP
jgi:hypothetical protein